MSHVVATPLTWEADPLLCPRCSHEMCIVSLIDDRAVIERILRHLGLWQQGVRVAPARAPPPPAEWVIEPRCDDPFPDYPVTTLSRGTGLTWRHRTDDDVRERLTAHDAGGLFFSRASGRVSASSGRAGACPARPEDASSLILTPPPRLCYRLCNEGDPSVRFQRVCSRAV